MGGFVTFETGTTLVVGIITDIQAGNRRAGDAGGVIGFVGVELAGELLCDAHGVGDKRYVTFRRGVSVSPKLGDAAHLIDHHGLAAVHRHAGNQGAHIGTLHQDPDIAAVVEVDEMLGKHCAIVGSTGTGKSCTVALVLQRVLELHENAHVVLLDPHNEYGDCFGPRAEQVVVRNMRLPYWLLTFEEFVEIVLGDDAEHAEEIEVLRELIPLAKKNFVGRGQRIARSVRERFTVDMPVPYRIADLLTLLEEEMGRLEKQKELRVYKRIKARLQAMTQDPRYGFMFGPMSVQDNLKDVLQTLFRIPVNGKPITVVQLMGLPTEVINVLVSVLARLVFDLATYSQGKLPITFVCEEAHRYVPADNSAGFEPTKRAISRIAKEGRKYGASLCIVSQRPGDLDPTILSQCSTVFTMRLTNERDQAIINSALSDASAALLRSLPLLGTREAIVFGEAVNLPSRVVLDALPPEMLPSGSTATFSQAWSKDEANETMLDSIIGEWRLYDDGLRERLSSAIDRRQENRRADDRRESDRRENDRPGERQADQPAARRWTDQSQAVQPPTYAAAPYSAETGVEAGGERRRAVAPSGLLERRR